MMSGKVSLIKGRGGTHRLTLGCRLKLRCSGQKDTVFPLQVLLRVMCKQMLSIISFRCQIKPEPRPNCPLGSCFLSDERPIFTFISDSPTRGAGGKVYMILSSKTSPIC